MPPRARTLAILEHDLVLLLSPGNKKIKSLAELKKKKVAVLADGDSRARLRPQHASTSPTAPDAVRRIQMAPQNATLDKLFASGGYGAVIAIVHASRAVRDKAL